MVQIFADISLARKEITNEIMCDTAPLRTLFDLFTYASVTNKRLNFNKTSPQYTFYDGTFVEIFCKKIDVEAEAKKTYILKQKK